MTSRSRPCSYSQLSLLRANTEVRAARTNCLVYIRRQKGRSQLSNKRRQKNRGLKKWLRKSEDIALLLWSTYEGIKVCSIILRTCNIHESWMTRNVTTPCPLISTSRKNDFLHSLLTSQAVFVRIKCHKDNISQMQIHICFVVSQVGKWANNATFNDSGAFCS